VSQFAYVAPERDPIDVILDMHLRSWYVWRLEYRHARGHKAAAVTSEYNAPGHFDWSNGAAEARADDLVDRAMEDAVQRIPNAPQRWRTAIEFEAMNLHCKAAVWESPYLPKNPAERETLVLEARNMLLRELRSAGVMT
jgi:hypothetical protein